MADNGDAKVIETARHIVKSLGRTDTMTDDMLQILSTFDRRFSREKMAGKQLEEEEEPEAFELEISIQALEQVILSWVARESPIWPESGDFPATFFESIDELQAISENWAPMLSESRAFSSLLDRAETLMQQAMFRLEDEFKLLMETNGEVVDPDWLFESNQKRSSYPTSPSSSEDEEVEGIMVAKPVRDYNFIIDVLPGSVVSKLHEIAKRMVSSGYRKECCHAFSSLRREFLEESILRLGFQKLSIEDVQKMGWEELEPSIVKWVQAMKVSIHVFFPSEKLLCDRVFANLSLSSPCVSLSSPKGYLSSPVSDLCFMEVCRGAMTQLLTFADAVSIGIRSPEKLFKALDMFEAMADLLPEILTMFAGEPFAPLKSDAMAIFRRIGETVRGIFMEFEAAIQRDSARSPVPGGDLHPLTRYVMNYLRFACDYRPSLDRIFAGDFDFPANIQAMADPPFASRTQWVMELLETSLETKAKLYKDQALSSLFLMNNLRYIVKKAQDSEMGLLLGDEWMRKRRAKVRQNHTNFMRNSWGKLLNWLRADSHATRNVNKEWIKERLRGFNGGFEELHRVQRGWAAADEQVREELRISVAEIVVPAYRSFLGRYGVKMEGERHSERYLKYSADGIEGLINELFHGNSGGRKRGVSAG
ncbi:exocyst complex component EXO70B1 [Amborella trichopoda]|uniref:Exocyst subunit Exo70 family protein n=1 Tax=Amborella trichopoda TaxID=13333 RepID=W1NJ63_AMBTC|nr:exocyst complex component EXO70B1 [Amborella trichopoda]ERM95563.1 hypothetical protein AMTR_s00023p00070760 [Amborella trichopoda]|eukprot:XP_006828147.1 exocyst complex component EXO70B1 [Amborella trichopoda]